MGLLERLQESRPPSREEEWPGGGLKPSKTALFYTLRRVERPVITHKPENVAHSAKRQLFC